MDEFPQYTQLDCVDCMSVEHGLAKLKVTMNYFYNINKYDAQKQLLA